MSSGLKVKAYEQVADVMNLLREDKRDPRTISRVLQQIIGVRDSGITQYMPATDLPEVLREMSKWSRENTAPICAEFKGIGIVVNPWDEPEDVERLYHVSYTARGKWLLMPQPQRPMPKEGEIFSLIFDDRAEDQPLEMVRGYHGCNQPEYWGYRGTALRGTQTRRFKRVSVGYCDDLSEVIRHLKKSHGMPAHGQWCGPFKRAFEPDGIPTGFADSSWVYPNECDRGFPLVYGNGNSGFEGAQCHQYADRLWIVEVPEED